MKTSELKEIAERNDYEFIRDDSKQEIVLTRQYFSYANRIVISAEYVNRMWPGFNDACDDEDMDMLEAAMAYAKTPPKDREPEKEKRYIVPLPGLITSKGNQQYLTHKDGHFFACCRNEVLRQTWKEEHLCHVPYQYRGYAVEVKE